MEECTHKINTQTHGKEIRRREVHAEGVYTRSVHAEGVYTRSVHAEKSENGREYPRRRVLADDDAETFAAGCGRWA